MKVFFLIYRRWSLEIVKNLIRKKIINQYNIFTLKKNEFSKKDINNYKIKIIDFKKSIYFYNVCLKKKPNVIFCLGWSNIISKSIYKNFLCICLHPSKLPNFRGGSPLQNQIIRNKLNSGLTLFKINDFIDGGPIFNQCKLNLKGNISNIFKKIEDKGFNLIKIFLRNYSKNKFKLIKQNLKNKKIYKRRNKSESFFEINELKRKKFIYFNNFINMLTNPYPNAYTIINNKKIYIQKIIKTKKSKYFLNCCDTKKLKSANNLLIKLKDCNVKIIKSLVKKS